VKHPLPHILLLPFFAVIAFAAVEFGNDLILKSVVLAGIICLCLYIRHIELANRDVALAASERLFRTMVTESIPIVFMYDTNGKILLSEGRMLAALDLKPKEIVGQSVFEVYKDFPQIIEALEIPLQGKHFEGVMQLGDIYFEVFYTPNKNTHGKVTSVTGMALDITAYKKAELTRKTSEERWKSLTESSSDHILLMDTDLNIEYINYTIPDLTIEQVIGQNILRFIPEDEHDAALACFNNVIATGSTDRYDTTYVNDENNTYYFDVRLCPLKDADGTVTGVISTSTDITERLKIEEALRRVQKMDAIGQLTGGIAHDFNNILSIIHGNLSMLEHQLSNDSPTLKNNSNALKRVATIQNSTQRAADLTKQLLDFSRSQSSKSTVCDINTLIAGMESIISHSLTPSIKLENVLAEDLWLSSIDQGDFQDSLLNLIINARDAIFDSGQLTVKTLNCTLDTRYCTLNPDAKSGDYVQIAISDNGSGIEEEVLSRIFEPFYTTKDRGKGTGLGLAMVFGFVKRSLGHIKVYSEVGIGTSF